MSKQMSSQSKGRQESPPGATECLQLFREMLRIRLIEERIADKYHEEKMRCPVHLSIGQEAVAVGTAAALRRSDRIVSTHRGHAHYLAKGGDLTAMLAEIHGKSNGCSRGRGGSMNLRDTDAGVMLTIPIVGSCIPVGVGFALAEKQRGGDGVTGVYLGDASVEEGVFHESANFAALNKLPVIFFCENNLYSVYTPISRRQPERPILDVAAAHGIPSQSLDGNDVERVQSSTVEAVANARQGNGPTFLLFDTYRFREHCGPNFDNDLGYRTMEEFDSWNARSPVELYREDLRARKILDVKAEQSMTVEIEREIDAAFEVAENSPFPREEEAGLFVYA